MAKKVKIDLGEVVATLDEAAAIELLHELAETLGYSLSEGIVVDSSVRWLSHKEYHDIVQGISRIHTRSLVWNELVDHGYELSWNTPDEVAPVVRCDRCLRPVYENNRFTHENRQDCTDSPPAPYGDEYKEYSIEVSSLLASYDCGFLKRKFGGKVTHRLLDHLVASLR